MTFNIFFSILAGLSMDVPIQGLLFLGIIPALILLYIGLKGYEGYYRDKTIFLTFIIKIIIIQEIYQIKIIKWVKDVKWVVGEY